MRSRRWVGAPEAAGSAAVRLRPPRDAREWSGFEGFPGATVMHSWAWLTWVAPLVDCRFVPLVVEHDGSAAGIVPVLLRRYGPLATANLVPFPYLGPVVPAELLTAAVAGVRRWLRRRAVVACDLQFAPTAAAPAASLAAAGLRVRTGRTYVVPIAGRSDDEAWTALGSDVRKAVRKSRKLGVVVRPSTPRELRVLLPAVHAQALGRAAGYVPEIGAALGGPVGERGFPVGSFTALLAGEPIGITVAVGGAGGGAGGGSGGGAAGERVGGAAAIGWLGAVFREHQHTQANTALIWATIEWARDAGMGALDMLEAPDPGIAAFKGRFATPTPGVVTASRAVPGLSRVVEVRRTLRRTVGRLPVRPRSRPTM